MKALIVGGTGPSGPYTVNGLLERGYEVTVLHGGQHEVEFAQPVEHIHADPHFAETLERALEGRTFDLAIATYGRIRIVAEVLKGKTPRFIAAGGAGVYARRDDPRWGPLGSPQYISEESPRSDDPNGPRFGHLMYVTEEVIMGAHREGHYNATTFRYPMLYGPHAPANPDWSMVRRILDGRKHFIITLDGLTRRRGFAANAAHAVLLAVDKPRESSGQTYNMRDEHQYSQRQQAEYVARLLHHQWEVVEMPPVLTARVYKGSEASAASGGMEFDIAKIRTQLGYQDRVLPAEALKISAEWLVANPPEDGGEIERQLGDPFAYAVEDELIQAYRAASDRLDKIEFPPSLQAGHMYRHPTRPGEAWTPQGG